MQESSRFLSFFLSLLPVAAVALPTGSAEAQTVRYVRADGSNSNNGQTTGTAWATLDYAINQIKNNTTSTIIYVDHNGGVLYERDIYLSYTNGSSSNTLTIESLASTATIDGRLGASTTTTWAQVSGDIYRCTSHGPNGASVMYGYVFPGTYATNTIHLLPYKQESGTLYWLSNTTTHDYSTTAGWYCGPGLDISGSDVRIRLTAGQDGWGNTIATGISNLNPGNHSITLFEKDSKMFKTTTGSSFVCKFTTIRNLNLYHCDRILDVRTAESGYSSIFTDFTMENCNIRGGRYPIFIRGPESDGDGGDTSYTYPQRLTFDNVTINGHLSTMIRGDAKVGTERPLQYAQGAGIQLERWFSDVYIDSCGFYGLFDGIGFGTSTKGKVYVGEISNCDFEDLIDDAIEIGSRGAYIEVYNNDVVDCFAGISWNETGTSESEGTKYIYNNVIDIDLLLQVGRDGMPSPESGPSGDGKSVGSPFAGHSSSSYTDAPDPWKIYHNTVIFIDAYDGRGAGITPPSWAQFTSAPGSDKHFAFNNILWQNASHSNSYLVYDANDFGEGYSGNWFYQQTAGSSGHRFKNYPPNGGTDDWADRTALIEGSSGTPGAFSLGAYPTGGQTGRFEKDFGADGAISFSGGVLRTPDTSAMTGVDTLGFPLYSYASSWPGVISANSTKIGAR